MILVWSLHLCVKSMLGSTNLVLQRLFSLKDSPHSRANARQPKYLINQPPLGLIGNPQVPVIDWHCICSSVFVFLWQPGLSDFLEEIRTKILYLSSLIIYFWRNSIYFTRIWFPHLQFKKCISFLPDGRHQWFNDPPYMDIIHSSTSWRCVFNWFYCWTQRLTFAQAWHKGLPEASVMVMPKAGGTPSTMRCSATKRKGCWLRSLSR